VRLQGTVGERFGVTQIALSADVEVTGSGSSVLYTSVAMPFSPGTDLEALEGMHISFEQTLKVSDIYNLGRYGQFNVSSQRLMIPTNQFVAGSQEALALAEANARNTLLVDDGKTSQNLDDIPFRIIA